MKYYLVAIALSLYDVANVHCANIGRVGDDFAAPHTHAIIIDAGSTGSRVNFYTFHYSVDDQLVLDDSLFLETEPELSAFAKTPKDVEKSLNILLDKAKTKVPRSQWASTPMSLRATAGLRLLPENEAQATDEGIFSWITTNYLLGKLDDLENSVAALDLGGGSNQVTFFVAPDAIPKQSPQAKNINHVSVLGKNFSVFSESFLGMGLNAAREKILTHLDNPRREGSKVTSECVSPSVSKAKWNYGGKTYVVSGSKSYAVDGSVGFDKCIRIIKKVVHSAIPRDLPSFKDYDIYAMSYYFVRTEESGLIDPVTGGIVTVESLHTLASKVCGNPNTDSPFMCLDLSYIYVLLHDGFSLDKTSNIILRRYINGHEVNWALGATFELLQNDV